jgi:Mn2+/Fe2+ NRAMP family transporter
MLAVPVLAGSAAYAIGEARRWPVGLDRKPLKAKAFYAAIVIATLSGIGITLSPLDPIKALFWSAVINGVVAVPLMVIMMLMSTDETVMRGFVISGTLKYAGWIAAAVMAGASLVMVVTAVM